MCAMEVMALPVKSAQCTKVFPCSIVEVWLHDTGKEETLRNGDHKPGQFSVPYDVMEHPPNTAMNRAKHTSKNLPGNVHNSATEKYKWLSCQEQAVL